MTASPANAWPDHRDVDVWRVREGRKQAAPEADRLAEETPVALEFNGISHATMLATPRDLEDFALGFALTEGIVGAASDVRGIDLDARADGIVVQLEIATACEVRLKERRRAMAGRTGCGLCGVETLPEVLRPVAPLPALPPLPLASLLSAMRALRARQPLHDLTGATHAAGWADAAGDVRIAREDVGRHNALDKLIGALARAGLPGPQGMAVVSSRASFEMVQKTASAGIGVLGAVSAPTALARRLAEQTGLTLAGFVRGADATLYTHPAGSIEPAATLPIRMDATNLIRMANRIGDFFEAIPTTPRRWRASPTTSRNSGSLACAGNCWTSWPSIPMARRPGSPCIPCCARP